MTGKLEDLMRRAANDSGLRDDLYRAVLDETLYIPVGTPDDQAVAVFSMPGQEDFTWAVAEIGGVPTVPAFTSRAALDDFLTNVAEAEGRWISTTGRKLLANMATSAVLHLEINPMSDYGLVLAPALVRSILRMEDPDTPNL